MTEVDASTDDGVVLQVHRHHVRELSGVAAS